MKRLDLIKALQRINDFSCVQRFPGTCRDRVSCVWQTVRARLYHLCVHANESCFLVERAVVGLLRLAIRLLRREDISSQVGPNTFYLQNYSIHTCFYHIDTHTQS